MHVKFVVVVVVACHVAWHWNNIRAHPLATRCNTTLEVRLSFPELDVTPLADSGYHLYIRIHIYSKLLQ